MATANKAIVDQNRAAQIELDNLKTKANYTVMKDLVTSVRDDLIGNRADKKTALAQYRQQLSG
ncbi:MAG: hypothetical protein Nk1A_7750 [Endomicrobiia bacterium]|nr:MAG: hypothetical protein Nk1A_7750 [Endomicrobiia bacterium]